MSKRAAGDCVERKPAITDTLSSSTSLRSGTDRGRCRERMVGRRAWNLAIAGMAAGTIPPVPLVPQRIHFYLTFIAGASARQSRPTDTCCINQSTASDRKRGEFSKTSSSVPSSSKYLSAIPNDLKDCTFLEPREKFLDVLQHYFRKFSRHRDLTNRYILKVRALFFILYLHTVFYILIA